MTSSSTFYFKPYAILIYGLIFYLICKLAPRWTVRIYNSIMFKLMRKMGIQYNKGFRRKFLTEFILLDPPEMSLKKSSMIYYDEESIGSINSDKKKKKPKKKENDSKSKKVNTTRMVYYSLKEYLNKNKITQYNINKSYAFETFERLNYHLNEYDRTNIYQKCCFTMINIDYITDIEYWLSFIKPVVIYTFVPEAVGGALSNGSFRCKNDIFQIIRGDKISFEFSLWDFGLEYITFNTCSGVMLCTIDQLTIPHEPNYRIILIVPTSFLPLPFSIIVPKHYLERLKVSYGDNNVLRVYRESGREVLSMSTPGSSANVEVPAYLFDIILKKNKENKQSLKAIQAIIKKEDVKRGYVSAVIIRDLLENNLYPPSGRVPRVFTCDTVRYLNPRRKLRLKSLSEKLSCNTRLRRSMAKVTALLKRNKNRKQKNNTYKRNKPKKRKRCC